jgi:hypothetical protein
MYPQGCFGYYKGIGIVQSSGISQYSCKSQTRICYDISINFDVCKYSNGPYSSLYTAQNYVDEFVVGKSYYVYRTKTDPNKCILDMNMITTNLPITGIVFLVLSGIIILILFITSIMCKECLFYDRL